MINNIPRHIWLIDLIGSANGITFKDISERWRRAAINPTGDVLPLRTFNNWKASIQKEFGLDFYCDRHSNKYYIRHYEDLRNGGIKEWLLNTFTVSNLLSERDALKGRIFLENVPSGQHCLTSFVDAMKENRHVQFTYTKFKSRDTQGVLLEPFCVKLYERRWYVLGRNVQKKELRTYALDRISDVIMLDTCYMIPKDFDGESYYADCFGVMHDDKVAPEVVRLRVHKSQCDYYRSLPLHSSQCEEMECEDYSIFRIFVRPTYDFIQKLLAQREFTEVLEPASLRQKMKEVIQNMLSTYE